MDASMARRSWWLCILADKLSASQRLATQRIPPDGTPGYTVFDRRGACKANENLDVRAGVEDADQSRLP